MLRKYWPCAIVLVVCGAALVDAVKSQDYFRVILVSTCCGYLTMAVRDQIVHPPKQLMIYLVKEINWGRVMGVYESRELAITEVKRLYQLTPEQWLQIYEFGLNQTVPDDIVLADQDEHHYFNRSQTNSDGTSVHDSNSG